MSTNALDVPKTTWSQYQCYGKKIAKTVQISVPVSMDRCCFQIFRVKKLAGDLARTHARHDPDSETHSMTLHASQHLLSRVRTRDSGVAYRRRKPIASDGTETHEWNESCPDIHSGTEIRVEDKRRI